MIADDWKKVDALLNEVLELPAADRSKFLDQACAGDNGMRAEIESLIACELETGGFLRVSALAFSEGLIDSEGSDELAGRQIGPYRIARELAHGGMGAVYLATRADQQYEKQVAIKLIKRGFDTDDMRRRFRHERQILASLDHPNIARLIDGGTTDDGRPYLVMDFVEGTPITKYSDEHQLSIRERLEMFRTVCSAVHYAHQNLVIHRDLKPGNVLVTADGTPKLLDFGIAKLLHTESAEQGEHTVTMLGVMTPDYASPEQVRGEQVTTASDVYSLGVLLYELLSGQRPYRITSRRPDEIARMICEVEPDKPSTAATGKGQRAKNRAEGAADNGGLGHNGQLTADNKRRSIPQSEIQNPKFLRGDLDNIVLMAMRKEPGRRYGSVEQLSEDIRRHLEGLPVIARKDTFGYRSAKFLKRQKVGVVAALLILSALVSGSVITTWEARAARLERDKARTEQAKKESINSFLQDMLGAAAPDSKGTDIRVLDVLSGASKRARTELADNPEVMADVLLTLGRTYIGLGQYDSAETDLRAALNASLKANGELNETTASIMGWLGLALGQQNKFAEGEPISREAVDLERKIHPNGHEDTGVALYALGFNLIGKNEFKSAEPVLMESSELIKKYLGEKNRYYMASLSMLGRARQMAGDINGAESNYRQSISIGRAGEYRDRIFLGQALVFLGELLITKKNYAEAESALRESERIYREQVGNSNYSVGFVESNLGWLYFVQSDYARAEIEYTQAFEILRKLFVPEQPSLVGVEAALGLTLTRNGKPKQGEPYLRQVMEIRKRVLPPGDVYIRRTESSLGECLTAQKRYGEAEPLLLHGYDGLKSQAGEQDQRTIEARQRLAKLYEAWRKPEQAARYR